MILALAGVLAAPPPPVVGGEETSEHPAVGALLATWKDYGLLVCTGTLVEADRVLTAAHCVEAGDWVQDKGWALWFVVGDEIYDGQAIEAWAEVDFGAPHPDYESDDVDFDVGVVHLAEPIDGVEPLLWSDEQVDEGWVGETFTYLGYGATSSALQEEGVKRSVELEVLGIEDSFFFTLGEEGRNLCSGDSGGPALREGASGWEVVGVSSFVWADHDETLCDDGGAGIARLDVGAAWLEEQLAAEGPVEDTGGEEDDGAGGEPADLGAGGDRYLPGEDDGGCSSAPAGWPGLLVLLGVRRRVPGRD